MAQGFTISALVTDGYQEWLHTERYIFYSRREAQVIFNRSLQEKGWKKV